MSLCALTLYCGVKIVRVITVESWEIFPKYPRNGSDYGDQTWHADRHYGVAGDGCQEFMTFRICADRKRGKNFWLPIKFPYGRFRSSFARSYRKDVEIFRESLITKFQRVVHKIKVIL